MTLQMLGNYSTIELHPQLSKDILRTGCMKTQSAHTRPTQLCKRVSENSPLILQHSSRDKLTCKIIQSLTSDTLTQRNEGF